MTGYIGKPVHTSRNAHFCACSPMEGPVRMRKIVVINPRDRKVIYKTVPDKEISRASGNELKSHHVIRFGDVGKYGLFTNAEYDNDAPEFFGLNGRLYHGTAVLYAFDALGRTVDIARGIHPAPMWFGSLETALAAVAEGMVQYMEPTRC